MGGGGGGGTGTGGDNCPAGVSGVSDGGSSETLDSGCEEVVKSLSNRNDKGEVGIAR